MLKRGFTLIEVLVALLVFMIGVGSIFYVFSKFAEFMGNRFVISCVTQAAYYALDTCSSGINPPTSITCGNITVSISTSGCNVPENSCGDISVTASYNDISYTLTGKTCNLGENP